MSGSPLSPRYAAVPVVVGSEVLFLGGHDGPMCPPNADCAIEPPRLRDAAAYDVVADSWQTLAVAPVGLALGTETAVRGDVVYALVPDAGPEQGATFVSYDRSEDRWSTLPEAPGPGYLRLVATDVAVIAYQSSHESGVPGADHA